MNKRTIYTNNLLVRITGIGLLFIIFLTIVGCMENEDSSGLEYMPDMYRSPAIEPYVDYAEIRNKQNPDIAKKLSAKIPPIGTIPYYGTDEKLVQLMLPYERKPGIEFKQTHGLVDYEFSKKNEYELAANDKINPIHIDSTNSKEIFDEGKKIYSYMCAHCHGEKGDGNGPMVKSGAYAGVPAYSDRKDLSNGQIFYSIYYGKGSMGAHGPLINKKEIWTLVHYIRKFQDPEYGKKDTTKPEQSNPSDVEANRDSVTVNNSM